MYYEFTFGEKYIIHDTDMIYRIPGQNLEKIPTQYCPVMAELGQAQLKLVMAFTLFFFRSGFSIFGLVELVW